MREWTTLALVVIAALARPVSALQASDVGVVDWHLPLIGPPRVPLATEAPLHRFHHTSISDNPDALKKSLLLTVTEENVLAALQPSSGDVVWRRRFAPDEPHPRHFSCSPSSIIVLSGPNGADLSSLNGITGVVEWTRAGPRGQTGVALCWQEGKDADVMWLTSAGISRLSGRTGETVWSWASSPNEGGTQQLARIDQDHLALVHLSPRAQSRPPLAVQILTSKDGLLLPSQSTATYAIDPSNFLLLGGRGVNSLAWVEKGSLLSVQLGFRLAKPSRLSSAGSIAHVEDIGLAHMDIFLVRNQDGSASVVSFSNGKLERQWQFDDATAHSLFASFVDRVGEAHIGHLSFSESLQLASLQILSLGATQASPSGVLTGHTFAYDHRSFGALINFAFEAAPAKDYVVATRAFISTATATIQAWEGATLAWSREEGLSTIDLPVLFWDPVMTSHESSAAKLIAQSSFFARAQRHLLEISSRHVVAHGEAAVVGHQLAFVASSVHRTVFALDLAQSGRIAWRAHIPSEVFEWSPQHRLQLQESATGSHMVALFESSLQPYQLDALTGLRRSEIAHSVAAVPPPVLSRSPSIKVIAAKNSVLGVHSAGPPEPFWTYHIGEHEQLRAIVSPASGAVASAGRVLGDRSTLLKYLNPNLVAVVTLSPTTASGALHFIDAATGALVHKVEALHDVDEKSQLTLVVQDNWIVCTYRTTSDAARSSVVISIELFHALDTPSTSPSTSLHQIRAFSRTFSSAQALEIKAITRTKLGITTASAVFVNTLGQLVAVPRRFLDARRPFGKPSKYDQEELLLPYEALLPSDPRWIVSHQTHLIGDSRIATFPGRLESEALLLASGLDFFGARISPSRSFDVLSASFNKIQLIVTISILMAALGVTRSMVQSRQVRQKWYAS